jgi:hypothetical protein
MPMEHNKRQYFFESLPKPHDWSRPLKVLVTMSVVMMAAGLAGALGQIVVHDIIPTFGGEKEHQETHSEAVDKNISTRGDLFATALPKEKAKPFYQTNEFVFALKFTHIHIFGMSAIFVLTGLIVVFLDLSIQTRTWLIFLPFFGVIIDLASVWLKLFVHPAFFWLHIPGGALFGAVFGIDSALILWQLWGRTKASETG